MNWFSWGFHNGAWVVPFWFIPLMFLWVVRMNAKNSDSSNVKPEAKTVVNNLVKEPMSENNPNVSAVKNSIPESGTSFKAKCEILSEVWLDERNNEAFTGFIEYNDLGLPLAYAISNGTVASTEQAEGFINEAFILLLKGYGLEDSSFESYNDILEAVDGAVFGEEDENSEEDEDNYTDDEPTVEESNVKPEPPVVSKRSSDKKF